MNGDLEKKFGQQLEDQLDAQKREAEARLEGLRGNGVEQESQQAVAAAIETGQDPEAAAGMAVARAEALKDLEENTAQEARKSLEEGYGDKTDLRGGGDKIVNVLEKDRHDALVAYERKAMRKEWDEELKSLCWENLSNEEREEYRKIDGDSVGKKFTEDLKEKIKSSGLSFRAFCNAIQSGLNVDQMTSGPDGLGESIKSGYVAVNKKVDSFFAKFKTAVWPIRTLSEIGGGQYSEVSNRYKIPVKGGGFISLSKEEFEEFNTQSHKAYNERFDQDVQKRSYIDSGDIAALTKEGNEKHFQEKVKEDQYRRAMDAYFEQCSSDDQDKFFVADSEGVNKVLDEGKLEEDFNNKLETWAAGGLSKDAAIRMLVKGYKIGADKDKAINLSVGDGVELQNADIKKVNENFLNEYHVFVEQEAANKMALAKEFNPGDTQKQAETAAAKQKLSEVNEKVKEELLKSNGRPNKVVKELLNEAKQSYEAIKYPAELEPTSRERARDYFANKGVEVQSKEEFVKAASAEAKKEVLRERREEAIDARWDFMTEKQKEAYINRVEIGGKKKSEDQIIEAAKDVLETELKNRAKDCVAAVREWVGANFSVDDFFQMVKQGYYPETIKVTKNWRLKTIITMNGPGMLPGEYFFSDAGRLEKFHENSSEEVDEEVEKMVEAKLQKAKKSFQDAKLMAEITTLDKAVGGTTVEAVREAKEERDDLREKEALLRAGNLKTERMPDLLGEVLEEKFQKLTKEVGILEENLPAGLDENFREAFRLARGKKPGSSTLGTDGKILEQKFEDVTEDEKKAAEEELTKINDMLEKRKKGLVECRLFIEEIIEAYNAGGKEVDDEIVNRWVAKFGEKFAFSVKQKEAFRLAINQYHEQRSSAKEALETSKGNPSLLVANLLPGLKRLVVAENLEVSMGSMAINVGVKKAEDFGIIYQAAKEKDVVYKNTLGFCLGRISESGKMVYVIFKNLETIKNKKKSTSLVEAHELQHAAFDIVERAYFPKEKGRGTSEELLEEYKDESLKHGSRDSLNSEIRGGLGHLEHEVNHERAAALADYLNQERGKALRKAKDEMLAIIRGTDFKGRNSKDLITILKDRLLPGKNEKYDFFKKVIEAGLEGGEFANDKLYQEMSKKTMGEYVETLKNNINGAGKLLKTLIENGYYSMGDPESLKQEIIGRLGAQNFAQLGNSRKEKLAEKIKKPKKPKKAEMVEGGVGLEKEKKKLVDQINQDMVTIENNIQLKDNEKKGFEVALKRIKYELGKMGDGATLEAIKEFDERRSQLMGSVSRVVNPGSSS